MAIVVMGTLLVVDPADTGGRVWGFVLVGAALAGWFLFAWRPEVRLTGRTLVVRNPLKSYRVPLERLESASGGYAGLRLFTLDGRIDAWAVQKTNFSPWLSRTTRADDVAAAILRRRDEARAR
jgi:hypothetical protein